MEGLFNSIRRKISGRIIPLILCLALLLSFSAFAAETESEAGESGYQLKQVLVLSRHNIRAPLSGSGSDLDKMTRHKWTEWTANESELTLKGGVAETLMGQYYRKWLEREGLIPENDIPADGEVLFYANCRQRTIATAQYFAAGMFPIGNIPIQYKGEIGDFDPVFKPILTFMSDDYRDAVQKQLEESFDFSEGGALDKTLREGYEILADVLDFQDSSGYQSGELSDWRTDDLGIVLEADKEPAVIGSLKNAESAADALVLQYYEEDDAEKAAFGHDLSAEEWKKIANLVSVYQAMRFALPLIGINTAHPLLMEIKEELENQDRVFTFLCGHDSNLGSVLSALGVTDYDLPETVEMHTPIGSELVFERWESETGEEYARIRIVYQSTEQLRSLAALTLENPPMSYSVELPGISLNEDGFYSMQDVLDSLDRAIQAYDELQETYGESEEELAA